MLDLNRFKVINDSLGHAAGDAVLSALAPRLAAAVRPTDTVARLGGDEFVVICPDTNGARGVTEIAKRLAAAVNRPVSLNSGEHFFTVSTGITLAGSDDDTPESLLRDADVAMYRARSAAAGATRSSTRRCEEASWRVCGSRRNCATPSTAASSPSGTSR